MVDPLSTRRWLYRSLFAALAALVLFVRLLPVSQEVGSWPGPDLVLALAVAWVMRRPDYVPPLLVGPLFLIADLLLQHPPGLNAALVVLVLELARNRYGIWRDLPFLGEWAIAAVLVASVIFGNWMILGLFMVSQASFGLYVIEFAATAALYPLCCAFSVFALGVVKPAPGSADALGQGA